MVSTGPEPRPLFSWSNLKSEDVGFEKVKDGVSLQRDVRPPSHLRQVPIEEPRAHARTRRRGKAPGKCQPTSKHAWAIFVSAFLGPGGS